MGKTVYPAPFLRGNSGVMCGGRDWTRSSNPSTTTDSILKRGVDPPFQIDRLKMRPLIPTGWYRPQADMPEGVNFNLRQNLEYEASHLPTDRHPVHHA